MFQIVEKPCTINGTLGIYESKTFSLSNSKNVKVIVIYLTQYKFYLFILKTFHSF